MLFTKHHKNGCVGQGVKCRYLAACACKSVPKDITLNEKYDWEGGNLSFYHKLLPISLKHEHRIKKGGPVKTSLLISPVDSTVCITPEIHTGTCLQIGSVWDNLS